MSEPSTNTVSPALFINESTLDAAYARLLLHVKGHPGTRVSPLSISIRGSDMLKASEGHSSLRLALDSALAKADSAYSVETVAFTIFPQRYLEISDSAEEFFDLYKKAFPRLKARNRINARGLYFERLTMFGKDMPCDGNQLKWFIERYKSRAGVRESMYQAAVFDPYRDHTNSARLGFPCLHSISFVPYEGTLSLNAFYPTQQIFKKAYGNYLGLINLGVFMAKEMGLEFQTLNVMVGAAKLDIAKSGILSPVLEQCRSLMGDLDLPTA